jgi:hypothetical protein
MDDIDRLDRQETQAVFRLVKISANFRHTVYVLAFDDAVVAAALSERYGTGNIEAGRQFLEKIVQVPLHLPRANRATLRQMVFQEVDAALSANEIPFSEPHTYEFVRHFTGGLQPALSTVRHVKRYANALAFALPLLKGEVHVGDLLLIEGIRILYPSLYSTIREHPQTLLKPEEEAGAAGDHGGKGVRGIIAGALSELPENVRPAAEGLVHALFPRAEVTIPGLVVSGENDSWEREKRIASPLYFPRYFLYAVPAEDVADRTVERIEADALAEDSAAVETALKTAAEVGGAARLIEKVRLRERTISPAAVRTLVFALARNGALFPEEVGPFASLVSTFSQAGILVRNLIKRTAPDVEREEIASEVIRVAEPRPFAAMCGQWLRQGKKEDPEDRVLSSEVEARVRNLVAQRVKESAAQTPPYVAFPRHAPKLLWFWREGAAGEVADYLRRRFEIKAEEATAFLAAYVPRGWSLDTGIPTAGDLRRDAYDSIAQLLEPHVVLEALQRVYGSSIADAEYTYGLPEGMSEAERIARQFAAVHRHVVAEKDKASAGAADTDGTTSQSMNHVSPTKDPSA